MNWIQLNSVGINHNLIKLLFNSVKLSIASYQTCARYVDPRKRV